MDYERKYKEANDKVAVRFGTNVAKEIFTDLYESEDERIRGAIIDIIKSQKEQQCHIDSTIYDEMIAWLEKQGGKKVSEYDVVKTIKERIIEHFDNHLIIDKCFSIGGLKDDILKIINEAKFEKQGEQKPIDKVEPKFKVGDWIVYNRDDCSREIIQVYDIRDSRYYFTNNVHFSWSIKECDEKSHLWTIQDAKDGDVLAYVTDEEDLWIMIYWSLYEPYEGHVHYHALLVNDNFSNKGTCCICIDNLKPATKEQCDQLEKAMAGAGWEFDFKKKELKKIHVIDEGKSEMDYCFTKMMNGEKVSPIWSEEDEEILEDIRFNFAYNKEKMTDSLITQYNRFFDKIKSLKPQPKQEWSEEDEKRLKSCLNILQAKGIMGATETINTKWLKSLKQRIGG